MTAPLALARTSPHTTRAIRRIGLVSPDRERGIDAAARSISEPGVGVTLLCPQDLESSPFPLGGSSDLAVSYLIYQRLLKESFDAIWFVDGTLGYFSLLARHQGLAFASTPLGVLLESPCLWRLERENSFLDHLDQLECDALERRSIAWADAVCCSDPAILSWMEARDCPRPRQWVTDLAAITPQTTRHCGDHQPLVSVCLVHHDRPAYLRQALSSLERQDYKNFEIVLVDDGSSTPEGRAILDTLQPLFDERGWKLVRQPNRYLGAARNTAARHARGEYLLFMDDDNIAKPHEISTFVRVAGHTQADVLTTFMDFFEGPTSPSLTAQPNCRWLFGGVDSLVGIARNCYGDANALVKREVFERLGGFTEDHGVTHEDWEFFARATLRGFQLEVIPDALFWYRLTPGSMYRSTAPARNYARSLRPFQEEVPASYRDLLQMTQGLVLSNLRLREQLGVQGRQEKPLRYQIADMLHSLWRRLPILRGLGPLLKRFR